MTMLNSFQLLPSFAIILCLDDFPSTRIKVNLDYVKAFAFLLIATTFIGDDYNTDEQKLRWTLQQTETIKVWTLMQFFSKKWFVKKKTAIKEKINDGGMNFFHSLTLAFSLFRSYTHPLTHSHLVYLYRSIETLLHTLSLSHSFSHTHNLAIFQTHAHSHSSNYLSLPP